MGKFIELHHKGKPHLLNIDRIVEIREDGECGFGAVVYQDTENELMVYVDEDYEAVKAMLTGEKKPQEPRKVTAKEIEKVMKDKFKEYCDERPCRTCKYVETAGECEYEYLADYINERTECE